MNKRLPLILSLAGLILLAASLAYWILQLYQPPQRPLAAVPHSAPPNPDITAAAGLFGGQVAVATATNYQLTGIVYAGRDSVAIIVADGAPPKALRVGRELSSGIKLAEVYPRYVMLSDGGVMKRIDLPADTKSVAPIGAAGAAGGANQGVNNGMMAPQGPQTPAGGDAGPALGSAIPPGAAPADNPQPEPPMSPGAVSSQMPGSGQIGPSGQAPAQNNALSAPVQMAPPTRGMASPGQVPTATQ
ncbi:type II secretion system protein N [Massilia phyllosphaerae]|uniref:type II secretion system protein N n=1 Tax=Massilia phyllosphaerae TaxID=3106034 RepID=UPI002B1CDF15|nr:type II secretion system protein N [Massilia sp. SGZ-792]